MLARNPQSIDILNNLAVINILWGGINKLEEAKLTLEYILLLEPDNEVAKENLKYLLGEKSE